MWLLAQYTVGHTIVLGGWWGIMSVTLSKMVQGEKNSFYCTCSFFCKLWTFSKIKITTKKFRWEPERGELGMLGFLKTDFVFHTLGCNDKSALEIRVYQQCVDRWEQRETEAEVSVGR